MLIKLHEKIYSIVPIHGISDNGDGTYRVDYISEPTEAETVLVNNKKLETIEQVLELIKVKGDRSD